MTGVPVDVCHECDGVWFDSGEISEVCPEFETAGLRPPSAAGRLARAVRPCPACRRGSLISRLHEAGGRRLEIAQCDRCGGLWLDLGALKRLGIAEPPPARGVARLDPTTGRIVFPRNPREWFVALSGMPLDVGNPCRIVPWVTIGLVFANVAAYIAHWHLAADPEAVISRFALTVGALGKGEYYRLVSAMFLHAGLFHLLGNLFFLYTFGDNLEERYRSAAYLSLYLACGLVAGVASCALADSATRDLPRLGASGAISGVLGAYLVTFPRTRILMGLPLIRLPLVVRVPVWAFLGFWVALNVWGWYSQETEGVYAVDHVAHLGGFVTGLLGGALLVLASSWPDPGAGNRKASRAPEGAARHRRVS